MTGNYLIASEINGEMTPIACADSSVLANYLAEQVATQRRRPTRVVDFYSYVEVARYDADGKTVEVQA